MRGIRKSFAGAEVLHGVDLTLRRGEVLALLGENGAGKSTLVKILNGDYALGAGEVLLDGRRVEFHSPRDARRAGIQVIYQELNAARDLSVAENVLMGRLPRRSRRFPGSMIVDWHAARRATAAILARLGADFLPDAPMRRLSVGQQQVVEVAKALSGGAQILVMDEPTAALTPREVDVLFETIASLRREGVGIIYISHRLDEVERVAQRVMVLRDGNVAGVADTASLRRRDIVRMMVGRDLAESGSEATPNRPAPTAGASPVLKVSHLTRRGAFEDVSFQVDAGETLGMFGLLGSGHLDVTRAVFGADPVDSGEVYVRGVRAAVRSPRDARRFGIGLVPEDRKHDAIVPEMSVADTLVMAHWRGVSRAGVLSSARQLACAHDWVGRLGVRLKSGVRQPIVTLSGGNQQKVVLARWLEARVKVLLLNEPTRGVDVGARADIYALLSELRREGLAVVVCSSDLEEVLEVSDRVLVFAKGRLVAEFGRGQADRVSLLAAAAAGDLQGDRS